MKLSKSCGVDLIGLDLGMCDQPNLQGVCDRDAPYLGAQHPDDSERVPCRFQHDLVIGRERPAKDVRLSLSSCTRPQ
jgi:hypothetical protein